MSDIPDTALPPNVLVLSTSLNPKSRSRKLAHRALAALQERYPGLTVDLVDLQELGPLPMAGTPSAWQEHAALDTLRARLEQATHVLMAVPIYNFSAGAVAKNVVELMSDTVLGGKTVGFLCSAGGPRGYMGILPLANALMLDFRCWIVPRFVYAVRSDFTEGELTGEDIIHRIDQLIEEMFQHGAVPRSEEQR